MVGDIDAHAGTHTHMSKAVWDDPYTYGQNTYMEQNMFACRGAPKYSGKIYIFQSGCLTGL